MSRFILMNRELDDPNSAYDGYRGNVIRTLRAGDSLYVALLDTDDQGNELEEGIEVWVTPEEIYYTDN